MAAVPTLAGLALIPSDANSTPAPGDPANISYMTFSGTICHPKNSTHAARISYSMEGVANDSTSSAEVWCTIPLNDRLIDDKVDPAVGLNPYRSPPLMLYAYAFDRHSSQNISCTLLEMENDAQPFWSWGSWKSSGSPSSFQSLKLSNGDPSIEFHLRTATSLVAQCTIPPKVSGSTPSQLISFQLRLCTTNPC
jgi:hypothetical protein